MTQKEQDKQKRKTSQRQKDRGFVLHYLGGQSISSGPFFDRKQNADRGMKLSKRKKREAKLSSQGHHLKKRKQKSSSI